MVEIRREVERKQEIAYVISVTKLLLDISPFTPFFSVVTLSNLEEETSGKGHQVVSNACKAFSGIS